MWRDWDGVGWGVAVFLTILRGWRGDGGWLQFRGFASASRELRRGLRGLLQRAVFLKSFDLVRTDGGYRAGPRDLWPRFRRRGSWFLKTDFDMLWKGMRRNWPQ